MRNNIITATVAGDSLYIKTDSVFQYDYGLKLVIDGITLPETYDVQFGNTGSAAAKTVAGTAEGVDIPDEYLRNGEDIHAYMYLKDEEEYGYTVYHIHIPVVDRAAIDTEAITPIQHTYVEKALEQIAEAVEETETNVSHYPYINEHEYWMVWDAENEVYVDTGVKAKGDSTFNLDIGTVTTLAPGTPATASITWEHGDARLNLGLPAGDASAMVSIHDERTNQQSVEIVDGADNVGLDDLQIRIIPVQEGSGAPGPRNIRRISGVSGVTLTHNSDVYEISFEDEAGAIYGGMFYPAEGRLVVDKAFVTKRCVDMDNSEVQPGWKNSGIREIVGENVSQVFTNQMLNIGTSYGVDTTGDNDILYLGVEQYGMRQTDWINTEITVQACIQMAEPIEYTLDPIALSTSLGNNTLSVDHGIIAYIKYPCDTKQYIDHKIAELQALVLEN